MTDFNEMRQELPSLANNELRDLAAHIAGLLAHQLGDAVAAQLYRRIADRLELRTEGVMQ